MIAILDYGMGNIHSVQKALESMGARTLVTNSAAGLKSAEKAVLPGVGAFDDAMEELKRRGLAEAIGDFVGAGKPFLGICLGMQLLFDSSEEASREKGLGILSGAVRKFAAGGALKVPHMGWNRLQIKETACPLLRGVPEGSFVYFCHSYYPDPGQREVVTALTEYGIEFASIVWKKNVYGVQFHPEKSQETGVRMLENFVTLC